MNLIYRAETKFLGVCIKETLKWNTHLQSLANKLSNFDRRHPVVYELTIVFIKIHQTQLDLYIHIKCCFWATSFGLITTIIRTPRDLNDGHNKTETSSPKVTFYVNI